MLIKKNPANKVILGGATITSVCIMLIILTFSNNYMDQDSNIKDKNSYINSPNLNGYNLKYDLNATVNNNEPITLKFWINEDWSEIYGSLIRDYTKLHPNVTFEINQFPWTVYWNKITVAFEAGEGPDIFHMHNDFTIPLLQYIEPIPESEFPLSQLEADFMQISANLIDGKLYYINVGSTTGGIFYNIKIWKENGLTDRDIPRTWNQLREIAKKLTKYSQNGEIETSGFSINGIEEYLLEAMNLQRGQFLFTSDGRFSRFNTQEGIENVIFLRDLYLKDRVGDKNLEPAKDAFGKGKASMIYDWAWIANDLKRNYPDIEYGFFRIPTWLPSTPPAYDRNNVECSFCVNNQSGEAEKEVSFDLLKYYLTNDKSLINAAKIAYIVPSKFCLLNREEVKSNSIIGEQSQYIERTCFIGILPNEFTNCLKNYIGDSLMDQNITPEKLLNRMDLAANKFMPSYRFESMERKYKYSIEFKK